MKKDVQVVLAGARGVRQGVAKALAGAGRSDVIVVQGDRVEVILGVDKAAKPSDVEARIDRLASTVREAVQAYGPARPPLVAELHDPDSGRIDARRLASYLDVPLSALSRAIGKQYKAVFKSPSSGVLQAHLAPLHRLVVSLQRVFGERSRVLVWLNSPNVALGGAVPMGLVMDGRGEVVADLVEGTLGGVVG
jgi:hypothetical protein